MRYSDRYTAIEDDSRTTVGDAWWLWLLFGKIAALAFVVLAFAVASLWYVTMPSKIVKIQDRHPAYAWGEPLPQVRHPSTLSCFDDRTRVACPYDLKVRASGL